MGRDGQPRVVENDNYTYHWRRETNFSRKGGGSAPVGSRERKHMKVFVLNMRGKPLMPCSTRKARILIRDGKAKIHCYYPFTIQLKYATGKTMQEVNIGIDTGSKHIGMAVTSKDKVLWKSEVELRQDVKSNIDTRREYRRSRRSRKTRYRKARFQNRKKPKGWLPPSILGKVQSTFRWIDKICELVPNPKLHIEVGNFDTQKMIRINEEEVPEQCNPRERRAFIFARDDYTCQVCKKKGKILQEHHIVFRSNGGTDRLNNLISVCTDCHTHENHQKGGILWEWQQKHKKVKQYKKPPFMNIVRTKLIERYPDAEFSYGYETKDKREALGIEKTHYNDAIAISRITKIRENPDNWLLIKQFRKKKRSLHEATARKGRQEPNRTQKRNAKNQPQYAGFSLNDKVQLLTNVGHISGFCTGGIYIKGADGKYISLPNKSYQQVGIGVAKLIHHNNNWQYYLQPQFISPLNCYAI